MRRDKKRKTAPMPESRMLDIRQVVKPGGSTYFEVLYEKINRSGDDVKVGQYWARMNRVKEVDLRELD